MITYDQPLTITSHCLLTVAMAASSVKDIALTWPIGTTDPTTTGHAPWWNRGIPCGGGLAHHKPQLTTAIWVKVKGGEPWVSLMRRSAMVGDGYGLECKIVGSDG